MAKKPVNKLDHCEAAIKRWETKLTRAMRTLAKLRLQRMRLMQKQKASDQSRDEAPRPRAHAALADLPGTLGPAIREAAEDAGLIPKPTATEIDTSIPAFLQRKKLDPVAQQIATEQADIKKRKAHGRIEKMKAKQRGDLKKMPPSGKAALDLIRNG